jgi:hypothetical protein
LLILFKNLIVAGSIHFINANKTGRHATVGMHKASKFLTRPYPQVEK